MIVEISSIFAIFAGGYLLMRVAGIRGWGMPGLGFIIGIALMVVFGVIQLVTGMPTYSILTLSLTFLIPFILWVRHYERGRDVSIHVMPAVLVMAAVFAAVIFFRGANLLKESPDSFRYVQVGSLLEGLIIHSAQAIRFLHQQFAVPMMHAPANIANEFYFRSITPILALATILVFSWFCQNGLRTVIRNWWMASTITLAATLLLLTNRSFIFHAFYIHSHMIYAAFMLIIGGCSWLYARDTKLPKQGLIIAICLAASAMIVTRAEASLHAWFVLLPVLASSKFPVKHKVLVLLVLALSIASWNGFIWSKYASAEETVPSSATNMFWLSVAAVMLMPVMFLDLFNRISKYILLLAESALWLALLISAVKDPQTFFMNYNATVANLIGGKGLWGYSFIILGILFVGTLFLSNAPDRVFLRFPVTTFIPLGLLLGILRGFPYHAGFGDSLNRMFLHIVPLAVLFIACSSTTDRWGFPDRVRRGFVCLKKRWGRGTADGSI